MISVYTIRHQKAFGYAMFEDQYMICNNHYICQIVNIDDLNTTITEHNFKYNLDTFDLVD